MFQILVVDDDAHMRRLMKVMLERNGFCVFTSENGVEALALLDEQFIDLVVLDVMMPKMDGYAFADTIRKGSSNLPILMVSAKEAIEDKRRGFLVGTDDYMTKPVDEEELVLRIRALLRRAGIVHQQKIVIGDVTLDYNALEVSRGAQVEALPPKEFYLLYKLLSYPNTTFTRYQLMDEIWGLDSDTTGDTVVVHVNRLRKRFEHWQEFEIITVRGFGYKGIRHDE